MHGTHNALVDADRYVYVVDNGHGQPLPVAEDANSRGMMGQAIYDGLASLLRSHRLAARLSQQELAGLAGLTRSAIANIEAGRQGVLLHHVYALAAALQCDAKELLPEVQAPAKQKSDAPRAVEVFVASLSAKSARAPIA